MKKIHNVLVACVLVLSAGLAAAQDGDSSSSSPQAETTPASRAEVLADLAVYRESGLLDLDRGDGGEVDAPLYQAALKRYQNLLNSPKFAALVRTYEAKTGENLAAVKMPDAATKQQ